MTTYFITRHPGALEWATIHGVAYDIHLEHLLRLDNLQRGDIIIGTLPVNIIYQINQLGVRYLHLSLEIPTYLRGIELNVQQLTDCKATIEEFMVSKIQDI